ncbi:hypothetical protein ANCCEY_09670 [Ancylostoma ceylanicum]|uniref:Uncharacterized protein n=1 Tax=Ancylostoma ceylanicum TaxID=53326 RepID=A0A0D6LGX7_9BILA|nr:hypothetical protein ANCCEY_09670 [Ancylostoma ceylanicum]
MPSARNSNINTECSDFRESIMPCWSSMGMTLTNHCTSMAQILQAEIIELMESGLHNLQQSMDALCRYHTIL